MTGFGSGSQDEPDRRGEDPAQFPNAPTPASGGALPPEDQGPPGQYPQGEYPGYGQRPPAPTPLDLPKEVNWASALIIITALVGLISAIIQITDRSGVISTLRDAHPSDSSAKINSQYETARWLVIVFGIAFTVLYVLLALQIRRGRTWARILTTVLLVLSVASGLTGLAGAGLGTIKGLGIINLLVDIAIVVLLWLKPSTDFFNSRRRPRY